ncbi:MAG: glycosyltransferase family 9 protein [Bilophila wadsworthia]
MEYGFFGGCGTDAAADPDAGGRVSRFGDRFLRAPGACLPVRGPSGLHAVYEYDKRRIAGNNRLSALLKSGRILGGRRYDIWIGAHPSPRSALLARLSGAPLRVGYIGGPVAALCYNRRVSRRFSELHEIERLLELLKPILPPETPRQHWPELTLPSEALEKAAVFRESLRQGDQEPVLLGLHPGSVWGTKRWLPSGFAEIARRAAARGAHVLVFAGPGEEGVARDVIALSELKGNPLLHDLSCALTLPELAAYLRMLNCYVSNDSGPMHLAWAQHTPVTALFGRRCVARLFPARRFRQGFEVSLECRPAACTGRIIARRSIIAAWSTSTLKPCGAMWRESWGCRRAWEGRRNVGGSPSPERFSSPLLPTPPSFSRLLTLSNPAVGFPG